MATVDDLEKRMNKLEQFLDTTIKNQNKVNQKVYDNVMSVIQAQNKVNQKAHDHIAKLEKRFKKLEKTSKKLNKLANPKLQMRDTMKLVDQALKAYDRNKKK